MDRRGGRIAARGSADEALHEHRGRIPRFLPGDRNLAEFADNELQRVTAMLNAPPQQ